MTSTTIGAGIAALAFAGLIILARTWRTAERIDRVEVRGAHLLSNDEITAQAQVAPRMSFRGVDLADVRRRLLANPLVRRADVVREREVLILNITERSPVARVVIGGMIRLIDGDGVVFPQREINAVLDLPLICGVTNSSGDQLDTVAVMNALKLLRAAAAHNGMIGLISVVRRDREGMFWLETNGDAVPVRVGTADDATEKFYLLHAFLPRLMRRDARHAEYVDVRFRDQVVVRWSDAAMAH